MELNGAPAGTEHLAALALTNYGHFTSMLVEAGRVRGLSLHLRRLAADCRKLFGAGLDSGRVRQYVRRAVEDATEPVVVRVTVYDPCLDLGAIGSDADPHVLVTVRPAPRGTPTPLRLRAVQYRRDLPEVKHVGLFGALAQRRTARRAGYDDVLFVNPDGTISELSTSNIGFVRGGRVFWPRSDHLPGVTSALLDDALDRPGTTEPLTEADLSSMDAAFATNAVSGVRAIASVGDTTWPAQHQALRRLQERYLGVPAEEL
ncbi:aminotransferase class IV family protein [Prauserella muralis]|uniref:Aminotransferase n=1 Tax=Prauserella muralis TaxID=588067 RepID=A0A2V4B8Y2_9PSEU|nr:aminotransferase class IV family protein [Prauserella muralis]PXY31700.1 aminotransferase [Prauserella muralis]TWE13924.1 branched-subunit amino acid aminotransferase/4-amino-4-deoxychorismate lyase [Prauserella muralis]